MTYFRTSFFALLFVTFGACSDQPDDPMSSTSDDSDVSRSTTSEPAPAGLLGPTSILSCVKRCNGDELCIECCVCESRGGDPNVCCS